MSLGTPQKARDLEVFTSALLKPSLGIGGPTQPLGPMPAHPGAQLPPLVTPPLLSDRWALGCVLCSVVLLVVVCNLLGLTLGIWGLAAREDPSHSEAKSEAGARFLMV